MILVVAAAAVVAVPSAIGGSAITERVSVDSTGGQANRVSFAGAISADGRFVTFTSAATNLVSGDTNNTHDVFVHDRETGTTERVSVNGSGGEANGESHFSASSDDGRYVVFRSSATDLVPDDTNAADDVFVRDRQAGTTERVSVNGSGGEANGASDDSSISADGRLVTFRSLATNLVEGDTNDTYDVFVHDRETGTTERVSVDSSGGEADGSSYGGVISADGRFVTFTSAASNLVSADANNAYDVFVRDLQNGVTECVSIDNSGERGNDGSSGGSTSGDGRFVVFRSSASNLVTGDTNGSDDVFVHDRETGTTERVSVDSTGGEGNDLSFHPGISADGRFAGFSSYATNLVAGDTNGFGDVFVHDRQSGATERVSVKNSGEQVNGNSEFNGINGDGRVVIFDSSATNLVSGDTNKAHDVFVRDLMPAPPGIVSFTPVSGITGSTVTIDGGNFIGATSVKFDGRKAKFKVLSANRIRATVPDRATSGKVTVTTPTGIATSASDYVVTFSIVKISPRSGPTGSVVTLTGIGFDDVTAVTFNGEPAAFTIGSATSIQATVPAAATTGDVKAASPQGTVAGQKFTVTT